MLKPSRQRSASPPLLRPRRAVAADTDPHRLPVRGQPRLLARLGLGRKGRNPAVGRIDDQRRLRQRRRAGAIRPDRLAVPAGVPRGRREVPRQRSRVGLLSHHRGLLDGQRRPVGQLLRPLERRERPVVPHPAEVGIAPGRTRRVRGLRGRHGRQQHRQRQRERGAHRESCHAFLHRVLLRRLPPQGALALLRSYIQGPTTAARSPRAGRIETPRSRVLR